MIRNFLEKNVIPHMAILSRCQPKVSEVASFERDYINDMCAYASLGLEESFVEEDSNLTENWGRIRITMSRLACKFLKKTPAQFSGQADDLEMVLSYANDELKGQQDGKMRANMFFRRYTDFLLTTIGFLQGEKIERVMETDEMFLDSPQFIIKDDGVTELHYHESEGEFGLSNYVLSHAPSLLKKPKQNKIKSKEDIAWGGMRCGCLSSIATPNK